MSLEQNLQTLADNSAKTITLLQAILSHLTSETMVPAASVPAAAPAASVPAAAPVAAPVPPLPAAASVEVAAPAVPVPSMPAASPVVGSIPAPFNDVKSLTAYCMDKYRTLGPVKGGMIQNVLTELGAANIGQLDPAKYGEFFAKVEGIA